MAETKYRNKLDAEANLRMQLSSVMVDFKFLCPSQQPHSTHREINNHLYNSTDLLVLQ